MKTLRQNLNNAYIRAMNKLGGKHARRRIVVYVESYDDVNFWRQLLAPLETERTCFEVLLPSHTTLCKGKKTYDKREALAKRDAKREMERAMREKNR